MSTRILTTPELIELNRRAVATERNRSFIDEIEDLLDPEGIHVVAMSMIHNDVEIRIQLLMKFVGQEEPVPGWLDISFEDYDSLSVVTT